MPRFVILHHDLPTHHARSSHWDLMLEAGEALLTWALPALPSAARPITCERLGDHRPIYLEYEGPISGNRGQVQRHESGTFAWITREDERIVVELHGQELQGQWVLTRLEGDTWTCAVHPSSYGKPKGA